ncbi:transmembrane signal receptor [Lithospermum erythrorhizon]|uniref:Transmembrane signal receptor n=1 Tax=Lithospermum erythrorhizon TaxID=34254 RepID=A0AAV3NKP1_LITER
MKSLLSKHGFNFTFMITCPTSAVKDMTPQEAWSGVKPSADHFRIWGCLAHSHVPKQSRSKLDKRSTVCIFIGICSNAKGYRLYDIEKEKVIISRDVVFEESKNWEWNAEHKQQVEATLECDDFTGNMDQAGNADNHQDGEQFHGENQDNDIGQDAEQIHEEDQDNNQSNTTQSSDSSSISSDNNSVSRGNANTRQRRNHRAPIWMEDYITGEGISEDEVHIVQDLGEEDPFTYQEAVKHKKWRIAMDAEIESIEKNNTWTLTDLPEATKRIGVKWIYKTKKDEAGNILKCKARLVAKGYTQEHGIDFNEVYAPVARLDTIRMIIGVAAQRGWKVFQLDVKSAFLQGELEEEVFVDQPQGYEVAAKEHQVYKLHKALYGLKQAPRAWYSKIESHFGREGFQKCSSEQTLFTKKNAVGKIIIVSIYVDDLIYTGDDEKMMAEFKASMLERFDMTDLGIMSYFLGIEVIQNQQGIFIGQRQYAEVVLKRFGMEDCNLVHNPISPGAKVDKDTQGKPADETFFKQMVGSLMYLTATRPDLMYVTCLMSKYTARPTEMHMQVAKRALRYLKGTTQLGIHYQRTNEMKGELAAYTDSDYAGDSDDRRSTSGYVFLIGSGSIAWSSKKQPIVTLSTTEAEYVAASYCVCQALWMKRILEEIGCRNLDCINIKCDNSSAIKLSKNPVMHGRSKHIDVRYHFLRDLSKEGKVMLEHCGTEDQIADIMTKPLKLEAFLKLRNLLGLKDINEVN